MNGYGSVLKPRNILRGATITFDGFDDANPTSLENATDGNATTSTGVGTKILGATGDVGNFYIDLGSVKTILFSAKIGVSSSANNLRAYLNSKIASGDTYRELASAWVNVASTSEFIMDPQPQLVTARYLKIRVNVSGAATGNIKIYELKAYELGD